MQTFLSSLTALTSLLLRMSLQASLVIVLVLLVQWMGRKHFSPRVRYALWLLVVLRLVLPTSLESSVSVFQHARAATTTIARAAKPDFSPAQSPAKTVPSPPVSVKVDGDLRAPSKSVNPKNAPGLPAVGSAKEGGRVPPQTVASTASKAAIAAWPWSVILSLAWLAGVVFLLARIIWIPLRLNARLARHETPPSPAVFEILEQAKRLIGVNQVLPIVQSRAVHSPALLGFIRPWLLLPHGLVEKFSPDELRLVFLHELAHLKRRDIAMNWLTTLLQILHWFNPLVWVAFARMRADREEACDELALSFARAEENRAYGHAIIKLLEGFSRPPALPGLVGILEDKQQMNRRITMIAQFKKMIPWSAPAAGLLLVLGIVTLTDAQTEKMAATARIFSSDGPAVKTLLSGTGLDASGILSPDESMVVYVEWSSNGGDVVVRDLRTGKVRNLTAGSRGPKYEYASGPCWAPDSQMIAYAAYTEGAGTTVRMVSREGGSPKIICDLKQDSFDPHDWSSDGKLLLGKSSRKGRPISAVAVVDVTSGVLRELEPQIGGTVHLRFSPDGRFITWDGTGKTFAVGVNGGERVRLTNSTAEEGKPVFSADGRHVIFSSNQRGTWDLWAVRCEAGRPQGAPSLVKYDFGNYPKWRTKSGKLAFTIQSNQTGAFAVQVSDAPSAAAVEPREIVKSSLGSHAAPAWSPDGKKVAYIRPGRPPLLCVQSLEDGREETFNTGLWDLQYVFWSPDNQTVALRGAGPINTRGVYVYSLATRQRIGASLTAQGHTFVGPLATGGQIYAQGKTYPVGFSGDGSTFDFLLREKNERVSVDWQTGVEQVVTSPADRAWFEAARAGNLQLYNYDSTGDGRAIAFVDKAAKEFRLVVADANNQNKQVVARVSAPAEMGAPRWSPDRTKLAYFVWANDSASRKQLHVCAADGSWDRVVNTGRLYISGNAMAPSWSPDSTRLAVTLNSDIPNQVGVLENLVIEEKIAAK
jgi:beta-lactamase regulating signal transducer with metallopeptidase domain/Tol biopolymer transport system component